MAGGCLSRRHNCCFSPCHLVLGEYALPKLAVTVIESILGSVATTDGRHAVLQARTTDDHVIALGVASEQLANLIDHCAFSLAQCENARRSGLDLKAAARWWSGSLDRDTGDFTLTVTFGKGGTMSFVLGELMAKALLVTLQGHYDRGAANRISDERVTEESYQLVGSDVADNNA